MYIQICRKLAAGLLFLCPLLAGYTGKAQVVDIPPHTPPVAVTALEYFIDTDPGIGNGTPLPVTTGQDIITAGTININGIGSGIHRVYLRAKNARNEWGLTSVQLLYISPAITFMTPVTADVAALEYFFDTDPGFGNATAIPVTTGPDVMINAAINTATLKSGIHYLGVRAKNTAGAWGLTNTLPVFVIPAIHIPEHKNRSAITKAEYFVDTDPGFGKATAIPVTSDTDVTVSGFLADIGTLTSGVHNFYVRTMDAAGNWSLTNKNTLSVVVANVVIPAEAPAAPFTRLEYFFDTDPGFGKGTQITVPATQDLQSYNIAADISSLPNGLHTLFIRTAGNWSQTSMQAFNIGTPLPVKLLHFSAGKEKETVQLTWETASEEDNERFVIERSADARAFQAIGEVAGKGTTSARQHYRFTDEQPMTGVGYYRLRQVDGNGTGTYSAVIAIHFESREKSLFTINNPVAATLDIHTADTKGNAIDFVIMNGTGQQVLRFKISGKSGETVNLSHLPAGEYIIKGQAAGKLQSIKFLKANS